MAIKRVTYNTLSYLVAEIKDRYAEKSAIGALGGLDKVAVENLADDLKNLINGKANAATTLAGYGITDGMTATEIASAISTAIAGTDHLSRVMVDSTADINVAADGAEKKIYMVKNTDGEAGNLYSEYMVIDGKLEKVGDWKVDLSSYAKTTEVTAAIALTRMYITPAPTHGTSLSVKSADRQKHRRAAMKKQSGIFLQERA